MTEKPGFVQIALRISPDLRERIKAAAESNGRSVNTELVVTLERAYPAPSLSEEEEWHRATSEMRSIISVLATMNSHMKAHQSNWSEEEAKQFDQAFDEITSRGDQLQATLDRMAAKRVSRDD